MLGAARAAARAIRHALGTEDIYAAHHAFSAYQGPSRLPLTALVHGTIRSRMPMVAAAAIESHLESSKTLRAPTLQAYVSALTSSEPQVVPTETTHTPTTAALTILAAARRSRQQQRTTHMYDSVIRACLIQGEILTGSLLFVLLVRDWKNRHRDQPVEPASTLDDPPPVETPPSPLEKWNRSFPTAFTSPIPIEAPTPPFPSPHLLEAIIAALDLRPRPHAQATHDLPPGRPPDSILALAQLTRLFTDGVLPFTRHAALLNALTRVPPTSDKSDPYFRMVLKRTCQNPPLLDTRSYNVLINYSLTVLGHPKSAESLVEHMSTVRDPPLRITDATRNILTRGEVKIHQPGLAARILSHIDSRGHSTRLTTNNHPPAPSFSPNSTDDLPTDPHLLAAHIHNITSLGNPEYILTILPALLPDYHLPHDPLRVRRTAWKAVSLGPVVLTSILNAVCKCGRTGLAERVHRLGVLAQRLAPDFHLPLAFHTMMIQHYAREARKGMVIITPKPSPLLPPHQAKAIVDVGEAMSSSATEQRSVAIGWGWDVPTPGGRTIRGMRRWALARAAVAHIYLAHVRPCLPLAQSPEDPEPTNYYTPDARLYNTLLETFGRRPNMLLRTYISNLERRRERLASRHQYTTPGTGVPQRVDAFVGVIVRDMAEVGMEKFVPGGWKHLLPASSQALRFGPIDSPTSLKHPSRTAERKRILVPPLPGASRWRPRDIRSRCRLGQLGRVRRRVVRVAPRLPPRDPKPKEQKVTSKPLVQKVTHPSKLDSQPAGSQKKTERADMRWRTRRREQRRQEARRFKVLVAGKRRPHQNQVPKISKQVFIGQGKGFKGKTGPTKITKPSKGTTAPRKAPSKSKPL